MKEVYPTNEQKQIIEFSGAPTRVLAGPGTGKTTCITEKIKSLIKEKKISYREICAITFTRANAAELRRRLQDSGIDPASFPYINTLHGFAVSILRRFQQKTNLKTDFNIVTDILTKILINDVIQDLKQKGINFSIDNQKILINAYFKNKARAGISQQILSNPSLKRALEEFSKSFHEHLGFYNSIIWADPLYEVIDLIDAYGDIKEEIHNGTKNLLVDEYQDLSPLEQDFVDKISGSLNGLCIVGDDDQSIYETFRFAAPYGIIEFLKKYPTAKPFNLSICLRCPTEVIKCALSLIQNNKKRVKKNLAPSKKENKGFVIVQPNKSKKEEIGWLVSRIPKILKEQKLKHEDIMILFRDGDIAKDYVKALEEASIPLNIQLKISKIFESEHFLGLISVIRWLINNDDNLSLRHFLYYWKGIGPETVRQLRLQALAMKSTLWGATKNITEHPQAFKGIRQRKKIIEVYNYLKDIEEVGNFYDIVNKFFTTFPESKKDKGCDVLKEYLYSFKEKENFITLKEIYNGFEQQIESGELEKKYKKERLGVCIMTMHSAKGCEAPIVIIPTLEDDIIPGNSINLEEERRLFYVSITRAKKGLYLSWARQRAGSEIHKIPGRRRLGKERSRFLDEMKV